MWNQHWRRNPAVVKVGKKDLFRGHPKSSRRKKAERSRELPAKVCHSDEFPDPCFLFARRRGVLVKENNFQNKTGSQILGKACI